MGDMSEAEAEANKKTEEEAEEGRGEDLGLTEEEAAIVIGKYAKGYVARKEVEAKSS